MIRLDFDFDSKLKQLETSQIALKEHLASDICIMKEIVGEPLTSPAIPIDMIEWADDLVEDCFAKDDFLPLKKQCPRILKYITVSKHLSQYLTDTVIGPELSKLLIDFPREIPLRNLLLHFFANFLSIENDVISAIRTLLLSFFNENVPRLALTQFYIYNNLNLGSNRSTMINKVLANIPVNKIFSNLLPTEVKGTEFYIELLIAIGGRLHSESSNEKELFWTEVNSLDDRELHMICLSKYTLKSSADADIELCKARAMKYVGDPSKHQIWQVTQKYSNRQAEIDQARKKIEIWINQQFITAFFQTMQASNRGDFWLDYVKHMERVQILGSRYFLQRMKQKYPSASQYLDNSERFKECGYSSEACVFMHFSDHIIILFDTENKAGIIRLRDDSTVPQFKYYGNVTSIINSRIQWAYRASGYEIYDVNEYGRYRHIDLWEYHLGTYLKQIVL